jgi:hypothetical protein
MLHPSFSYIAFRNVTKVHDEWFANEESVRKKVGLLEKPVEIPNLREVSIHHIIKFVSAMSKREGRILLLSGYYGYFLVQQFVMDMLFL